MNYKFLRYFILLLVFPFIWLSCAGKNRWATHIDWREIDFASTPAAEDYPEDGAIILLDSGQMRIVGNGNAAYSVFERHKLIKILNIRGEKFANIMIPYFPGTRVSDIQARTISPAGKITILQDDKIFDVNLYPNFIFYSDQRAKIFTLPAVVPGSIIEYCYQVNISGGSLWHSWMFQEEIPTRHSRFTLVNPSEWELKYRLYHLDLEPQVEKTPAGFKSSYLWEVKDMPSLKTEFAMPPRRQVAARLAFAPLGIDSWNDVAGWYHDLAAPRMKPTEEIKILAKELTDGISNPEEKLQRLFEWVRDKIRYVAVEIGIGGYQPHPASEVMFNHYGDCKDMTTLLCTLAGECGIPVFPVLISTRQNVRPDTSLPSPFQFNHAIAYCPSLGENGIWMDATEKGCPFNKLPWYDQSVPVLIVDESGNGEIRDTPQDPGEENRSVTRWNVTPGENGSAQVSGEIRYHGALAAEMREEFMYSSGDDIRHWLEIHLSRRCISARLDTFFVQGLQPVVDPLIIRFQFQSPAFFQKRSNQLILRPAGVARFELPDYFQARQRRYPIHFRFGFEQETQLTIKLNANLFPEKPRFEVQAESPFGNFFMNWFVDSQQVFLSHVYRISSSEILPDQYQEFQAFLADIRTKDQEEIILRQSEMTDTLTLSPSTLSK